ncbi:hypothetical protein CEP54_003658 [Fusarium duplospermum]|uniref:Uncharacterized protein n=1 Tax=Fusarium duplospermum TaxID=1325734 RepID=A0A428QMH7_9HYPO|nr:hypothetical protein CEP54_003658 [Fusarium duplospermum]
MAPSDRTSELFWLEYGEQIKNRIPRVGQGKMFFLADEAQKAPPVGTHIPNEYKAKGLYDLSNNLLATDSIYYSPSASHGFDKAVETYLNWVDLGDGGGDRHDLDEVFHRGGRRRDGAQDGLEKVRKRAFARWERETEMGMTFQPFDDWAACGNAPELNDAQQSFEIAALTINHIQRESNIPRSSVVQQDKDTLNKALSKHNDHDGHNMRAAAGSLLTSEELIRNQQNGERVRPPSYERVPLYESPDYERFVQRAMGKSSRSNYNPSQSIRFTIDTQKDTSHYNFGQTRAVDSVGASTGWFSFSTGGDRSRESSTLETGSETAQVSIKVTYDDLQVVTINTGNWVPDVSKYKLRRDAPRNLRTLARVRQLVVVSGLGYEITVPRSTARILDSNLRATASAGGSISVFGIRILLGRSGSSTREEQTHTISRDQDGVTWKIIPNYGSNCGTVVGVIGEPFGS